MIYQTGTDKVTGESKQCKHEWGVILAGGDGIRLKSLTRKIAGDERPKQFCSVLGSATLLEETQRRTALELAKERTLYCQPASRAILLSDSWRYPGRQSRRAAAQRRHRACHSFQSIENRRG
jgi:hypothetical protein